MRYPLQPLLDAMGATLGQVSKQLGIGGPEYRRYKAQGMSRDTAERKAMRVGFHPYEVWPEMAEHDAEALPLCAYEGCQEQFVPTSHRQKYHSDQCRNRAKVRRWRQSERGRAYLTEKRREPSEAEKNRERRRRYYQENADYERARQRRYEAAKRAARKQHDDGGSSYNADTRNGPRAA